MTSVVPRFEVRVEEGAAQGGLFVYEQTTYYHVVDLRSNEVVMTFESETTTASLSAAGGHSTDHNHTGVSYVSIAPDQRSVRVQYHDGWEDSLALPE
jgi:hypothetical protein